MSSIVESLNGDIILGHVSHLEFSCDSHPYLLSCPKRFWHADWRSCGSKHNLLIGRWPTLPTELQSPSSYTTELLTFYANSTFQKVQIKNKHVSMLLLALNLKHSGEHSAETVKAVKKNSLCHQHRGQTLHFISVKDPRSKSSSSICSVMGIISQDSKALFKLQTNLFCFPNLIFNTDRPHCHLQVIRSDLLRPDITAL